MEDYVLIDGDTVQFLTAFAPAMVVVRPGVISASFLPPGVPGSFTVNGKRPCVEGDERLVQIPGCPYTTPEFSIPGIGTLKIASLAPNQYAQQTRLAGKRVLLKGGQFQARFDVQTPAMRPPPGPGAPIPDPMPTYQGIGMFVTTNTTKKAV